MTHEAMTHGALLHQVLPPQVEVMREIRKYLAEPSVRISSLAIMAESCPVITLELIKLANTTFYSGARPAIADAHTALVRLGSETTIKLFDELLTRSMPEDQEVAKIFEELRNSAVCIAELTQRVAKFKNADVKEFAKTAALMSYIGHKLACLALGTIYAKEYATSKKSILVYKILTQHHIDINKIGLEYLKLNGTPQMIFFGLDRELKCKTPTQASLRMVVESATEIYTAHCDGKLDKFSPKKGFPQGSSLRLIGLNENQHNQLYEELKTFLSKPIQPTLNPQDDPGRKVGYAGD